MPQDSKRVWAVALPDLTSIGVAIVDADFWHFVRPIRGQVLERFSLHTVKLDSDGRLFLTLGMKDNEPPVLSPSLYSSWIYPVVGLPWAEVLALKLGGWTEPSSSVLNKEHDLMGWLRRLDEETRQPTPRIKAAEVDRLKKAIMNAASEAQGSLPVLNRYIAGWKQHDGVPEELRPPVDEITYQAIRSP